MADYEPLRTLPGSTLMSLAKMPAANEQLLKTRRKGTEPARRLSHEPSDAAGFSELVELVFEMIDAVLPRRGLLGERDQPCFELQVLDQHRA